MSPRAAVAQGTYWERSWLVGVKQRLWDTPSAQGPKWMHKQWRWGGDTWLRTWHLKIQQPEAAARLSMAGTEPIWEASAGLVWFFWRGRSRCHPRVSFASGYTFTCLHHHLLSCSTEAPTSSSGTLFACTSQAGKTLSSS